MHNKIINLESVKTGDDRKYFLFQFKKDMHRDKILHGVQKSVKKALSILSVSLYRFYFIFWLIFFQLIHLAFSFWGTTLRNAENFKMHLIIQLWASLCV